MRPEKSTCYLSFSAKGNISRLNGTKYHLKPQKKKKIVIVKNRKLSDDLIVVFAGLDLFDFGCQKRLSIESISLETHSILRHFTPNLFSLGEKKSIFSELIYSNESILTAIILLLLHLHLERNVFLLYYLS